MKKASILTYLFSAVLFLSCQETIQEQDAPTEQKPEKIIHQIPEGDLETLTIDECEYLIFKDGRGTNHGFGYMSHKGNCKNPIHYYQLPIDSVKSLDVLEK